MFLHQKKSYNKIETLAEFKQLVLAEQPKHIIYDTETTGLDNIIDKPFIYGFCFGKNLFVAEPSKELFDFIYNLPFEFTLWAHNAKFDWHMTYNTGYPIPEHIKLADSLTLARLTEYADDRESIGLAALGQKYVDDTSKFAGKVIQQHINDINKHRLSTMKAALKQLKLPAKLTDILDEYKSQVQYIKHEWDDIFKEIDKIYKQPTYEDSYKENPNLMINYLYDDLVITREYIKQAFTALKQMGKNMDIFEQENKLIRVVGSMERVGLKVDINYLINSRAKVLEYKNSLYQKLKDLTGEEFTVGQHKFIKELLQNKYGVTTEKTDLDALHILRKNYKNTDIAKVVDLIITLRTIDKWLSTYIEGKLNKLIGDRFYTKINNAGTITGRVSSDFQQEPKEPLLDADGNELFHPRRAIINDDNSKIYYFDYSQMELRVQAQYTINISGGDENLCRAFIPFNYKSLFTGETYRLGIDAFDSDEWVDENGNSWDPIDLHSVTTLKAFPELGNTDHPEFKNYRKYGKQCNFLKNYGGGIEAIKKQIIDDDTIAAKLNKGYYDAFPKILDYQKWVESQLAKYGYVENIYGRRYYLKSSNFYYRAYNYLIQGSCADMVKEKEIQIYDLLKDKQSQMLLPVHDEIQIRIINGEEYLIKQILNIMQDTKHVVKDIPMICDIEVTHTNWADKEEYHEQRN